MALTEAQQKQLNAYLGVNRAKLKGAIRRELERFSVSRTVLPSEDGFINLADELDSAVDYVLRDDHPILK